MENKNVRGILGLVVVTLISFGVILGTRAVTGGRTQENSPGEKSAEDGVKGEELDVSVRKGMEKAVHLDTGGYETVVRTEGYGGDIVMEVNFREDKRTLDSVAILEQSETEGLGAKITEKEFLGQFKGMTAPVWLEKDELHDNDILDEKDLDAEDFAESAAELEGAVLKDGVYKASGQPDDTGFYDQVAIRVEDGRITEASWDAVSEKGESKAGLSQSGQYTMTEDGLTWKEQSEALARALIESQSLTGFAMDEQGKTDAVAGVSISIRGFLNLAEDCLRQAAGMDGTNREDDWEDKDVREQESDMDAVSGATISSAAVKKGINLAYEFIQEAGR